MHPWSGWGIIAAVMTVLFSCPHCRHELESPPRLNAVNLPCPACGRTVRAPATGLYPGVVLDAMRIERRLGRGAMGEVYLATHLNLDRKVALKVLSPAFTGNREAVDRFMKEVRNLAKLTHPNLITAYTAGSCEDIYYLAMSYVAGETMHSRIQRKGPLAEEEALSVALCVARALRYAWERHHILHRDVKPANIMVDDDGEIKLTDLGLSKSLLEEGEATQSGLLIGTPHYMSPEQARGESVTDVRTDIYGLGATLYHMLCGGPPFPSENVSDILRGHLSALPPSVRDKRPASTPATTRLVAWMMAKDPARRPANWTVVEAELEGILQRHFPTVDPHAPVGLDTVEEEGPGSTVKTQNRPRMLGGFVLVVGVLVGGLLLVFGREATRLDKKTTSPVVATNQPESAPPIILSPSPPAHQAEMPPRLRALRAQLPQPQRDVMLGLDREVAPLIRQRQWAEAAAVYTNYHGPHASDTERLRRITAERLLGNRPHE
jgi:serine/threonine-protein kinase